MSDIESVERENEQLLSIIDKLGRANDTTKPSSRKRPTSTPEQKYTTLKNEYDDLIEQGVQWGPRYVTWWLQQLSGKAKKSLLQLELET